jgi:hypothetical protein
MFWLAKRTACLYATPTFWLRGYGMSVIWGVDHPTWKRWPRRTGTIFTFLPVATCLSCKMDCEMVRRSGKWMTKRFEDVLTECGLRWVQISGRRGPKTLRSHFRG